MLALAVGFAVTFTFLVAASALHAYADARPVASRETIRLALSALAGANAVGAAFFAIRAIPTHPLLGSLGAFATALAPAASRAAVLAALRAEERRAQAIAEADAPEAEPTDAPVDAAAVPAAESDGHIEVPGDALLVLIGAAGCGKSTFASRRFAASQVVSSDECRELVSDDVRKPSSDAFRLMYQLIGMRLKRGHLTVADATNVTPDKRAELLAIAKQYKRPAVAIVLDLPEQTCRERNEARPGRKVPVPAIRGQMRHLRESLPRLAEEGFAGVHVLDDAQAADDVVIEVREPEGRARRGE